MTLLRDVRTRRGLSRRASAMNLWYIAYVLLTTVILHLALIQPALAASKVSQAAAASRQVQRPLGGRGMKTKSKARPDIPTDVNLDEWDNGTEGYYDDKSLPDEHRLLGRLLHNYDSSGRPVFNASHAITVKFGLTLIQIADMDEVNQVLTTNVWLEQEWVDERLFWNPAEYNNLEILRIPCQRLWLPDVVLYNSADDFTVGFMHARAMVRWDGTVFWAPPAKLRSSCKIDITYFPFDDQRCKMKFGSWSYDGFQVDITNRSTDIDLTNYVFSGEWDLLQITLVRNEVRYACCIEPYPDVTFTVVMRRRTLFYIVNIILPCLWLTVLSLIVFWLPPDSGEKVTLGITVLLAFSVFMLLIAESIPATSEYVPLVVVYLTVTMALTSMSIILTVAVLQLHHVSAHQKPPSSLVRAIVFNFIACAVGLGGYVRHFYVEKKAAAASRVTKRTTTTAGAAFITHPSPQVNGTATPFDSTHQFALSRTVASRSNCAGSTDGRNLVPMKMIAAHAIHQQGGKGLEGGIQRDDAVVEKVTTDTFQLYGSDDGKGCGVTSRGGHVGIVVAQQGECRDASEQDQRDITDEWRLVAIVIDRLLFWIFLIVSTVSTAVILLIQPLIKPSPI